MALLLSLVFALKHPNTQCMCVYLQLKEMCRRELDKSESEIKKNGSIIGEYKQVCTSYPDDVISWCKLNNTSTEYLDC